MVKRIVTANKILEIYTFIDKVDLDLKTKESNPLT